MTELERIGTLAKEASVYLSTLDTEGKNNLLRAIADALRANADYITAENAKDLANARENGLSKAMQDRLLFDGARIDTSADGVLQVVSLPDPVGEVMETYTRPNGMTVEKRRVPMGVVGIIYEARPNVTVDTAVLCIKASNAVMLRGGKEAIHTNTAIVKVMKKALSDIGADENMIGFVEDTSRDSFRAAAQG